MKITSGSRPSYTEEGIIRSASGRPFVDIIEVGTRLIKREGLRIVSILKEWFPEKRQNEHATDHDLGMRSLH